MYTDMFMIEFFLCKDWFAEFESNSLSWYLWTPIKDSFAIKCKKTKQQKQKNKTKTKPNQNKTQQNKTKQNKTKQTKQSKTKQTKTKTQYKGHRWLVLESHLTKYQILTSWYQKVLENWMLNLLKSAPFRWHLVFLIWFIHIKRKGLVCYCP